VFNDRPDRLEIAQPADLLFSITASIARKEQFKFTAVLIRSIRVNTCRNSQSTHMRAFISQSAIRTLRVRVVHYLDVRMERALGIGTM
jgi:hypothetical protein